MLVEDAIHHLNLPYTYEILPVPKEKRAARQMLGKMSSEMLVVLRDDLIEHAFRNFEEYKALTKEPEDARLAQGVGSGEGSSTETPRESSPPQQEGV